MRKIGLEELKRIQLEMLVDIVSFCNKQKIKYFLAYGTLLGAVRHGGYIPWDDDIDICLPRPDYERFISIYENKYKDYRVLDFRITKGYYLPFAKVSNMRTVLNEYMYEEDVYGVYIDVFPIDGYSDKRQIFESKWLLKFLNTKKAIIGMNRTFLKNIVLAFGKMLLMPIPINSILLKMHSIATTVSYEKSEFTVIFCSSTIDREIVPKDIFKDYTIVRFEGVKVTVPKKYDEYLTYLFGNYMELPPVEKRITHHYFEAWWK